MAAPVFAGNVDQTQYDGPGLIMLASYDDLLATPANLPTFTAASSAFTNVWDDMWVPVGFTDDGFELDFDTTTTEITAAEQLEPLDTIETRKTGTVKFSMLQNSKFNIQRALNGGTWTTSGTGAAQISKYTPGTAGARKYSAVAWLSASYDMSAIVYKTSQTGSLAFTARAIGTKRVLACNFAMATPSPTVSTSPWNLWVAGTKYDA